ncbi:hypothetical protein OROGR_019971 [Orobanche gracilis]
MASPDITATRDLKALNMDGNGESDPLVLEDLNDVDVHWSLVSQATWSDEEKLDNPFVIELPKV